MVKDSEVKEKLVAVLLSLAADAQQQQVLKTNIAKQKKEDADKQIVDEMLAYLK